MFKSNPKKSKEQNIRCNSHGNAASMQESPILIHFRLSLNLKYMNIRISSSSNLKPQLLHLKEITIYENHPKKGEKTLTMIIIRC